MNSHNIISTTNYSESIILNKNMYRKPLYTIENYLYSLFGNNDVEMTNHITNIIYNSPTKFTLHFYYGKFSNNSGITTFMKYLELLFPNIIMEVPLVFIKNTNYYTENINEIKNKTILFIDNYEMENIDVEIAHILKNMNIHLILITKDFNNNHEIYENNLNINFVEFPYKFVNRQVTSLEDINVKSSDTNIIKKLVSIQNEAKDYLLLFHMKNNVMIPMKKRRLYK
jgi:hypothetical protein